jgi:uncharacterized RDD family membrane protein YckC
MFGFFSLSFLYYAVFEGFWGAAVGKAICRLRVARTDKSPPGFFRALLRALIYIVLPGMPYWAVFELDPRAMLRNPTSMQFFIGMLFYVVLALLFSTVRRRNGYAAVQDLITKTRVISRAALASRPLLPVGESQPPAVESSPVVGPYHVLETLETSPAGQWLLGYDLRLLRKVWIHTVPAGAPPVPASMQIVSRMGRLRWISGRRSPEENWDVFEGVSGKPLLQLIRERQPWSQVRFWIYDLACEINAAEKDGTLPPVLTLDRVWITGDGRAKLLDFPAPGLKSADFQLAISSSISPFSPKAEQVQHFLSRVAVAALEGRPDAEVEKTGKIAARLPLHARDFLKNLPQLASAEAILSAIKPLLTRVTVVSRLRRAAVLAGCLAFPLIMIIFMTFSMSMMRTWRQSYPEIMELSTLLQQRQGMSWVVGKDNQQVYDEKLAIYIASHYRAAITDNATWNGMPAFSLIQGESRQFAEQSLVKHPSPTEEEIAEAEEAIKPYLTKPEVYDLHIIPLLIVISVMYTFFPTVIAAILFRGGLIIRMASMTFVRRDGAPASRLRVFWRTLVAWGPLLILVALVGPTMNGPGYTVLEGALLLAPFAALTTLSLLLPTRGLPDYLAGTWPVPR